MEYESPLSPYDAIKKTEKFFTEELLNVTIKEKPIGKGDAQMIDVGISGGKWEIFWMKVYASKNPVGGSIITTKGRSGLQQLSFAAIILVLSGPFFFLVFSNENYWVLAFPVLLLVVGFLSILMPIIRVRTTNKQLKEVLTGSRDVIKGGKSSSSTIRLE